MNTKNLILSKEQQEIADYVTYKMSLCQSPPWHWNYKPFYLKIGGYAGTGKTVLLAETRKQIARAYGYLPCAFVSFTGKAASVLAQKLQDNNAIFQEDFVGTIHSLIYKPVTSFNSDLQTYVITSWKRKQKDEIDINAIFIDEASMVTKEMWDDLKAFGISLIAVGDHGQLPPVGDDYNLLSNCDYYLRQVHRQSLDSPIIKLAHHVRKGGRIQQGMYSPEVFKLSWYDEQCRNVFDKIVEDYDDDFIILTGMNKTRNYINNMIRKRKSYTQPEPYPMEKVVCLKNNYKSGVMNGIIGNVLWYMPHEKDIYRLTIQFNSNSNPYDCLVHNCCFGQEKYNLYDVIKTNEFKNQQTKAISKGQSIDFFDFGYAISVHKSQGSEWEKVILVEERAFFWDDEFYNRWLYTALTRAKEKLFIIQDF